MLVTTNYTFGTDALKEWLLMRPSMFADENDNKVEAAFLLEALTTPDAERFGDSDIRLIYTPLDRMVLIYHKVCSTENI